MTGKIRIAEHIEVEWRGAGAMDAACPNCGTAGGKRPLLDIDYRPPGEAHHFILLVCPACGARFPDNDETMDYGTDQLIEIGWNIYQVQLGAGVWPISAPLARVEKPRGARVLEIGGAFGFGLDFGIRAKGWDGMGFDPSPLARFGAEALGLALRQDYFEEKDLALGKWDVAVATEVVEHLPRPGDFLRLMRRALADDGVLVLTTPDAALVTPELSAGELLPLLSPGAHVVLQTAESLKRALHDAGFAHAEVRRSGLSLTAYASAAPFRLDDDEAAARALYRRYLVERAALTAPESDSRLGFAGRGVFEAANDGDWGAVEAAWLALLPAVQARFGIDLETMTALPAGAAEADLATLAKLMPLGLGMILFGRAMQLLALGERRAALRDILRLSAEAIAALQGALGRRSLTDGLSASIARILDAELLLCGAEDGNAESLAALARTGDEALCWRGFVALVNAGETRLAATLKAQALPDMPGDAVPPGLRRNALLSLVNLHLAPGGDALLALPHADALRNAGENMDEAVLGVFTRLVNESRHGDAVRVADLYGVEALARLHGGDEPGRDALLALAVLDLAMGDPAEIPGRLEDLGIEPERRDAPLLVAFGKLVNAARYEDARGFSAAHDVPGLAGRARGEVARDAAIGRALLELGAGDPALVPGLLAGADMDDSRREELLLSAFTGLVNAGRHEDADAFAAHTGCLAWLDARTGQAAEDARVAALLLDLQQGRRKAALRRAAALEHTGAGPADVSPFYADIFIRLVNDGAYEQARELERDHGVEWRLAYCAPGQVQDASAAALMLDMQQGGQAARIPGRLDVVLKTGMPEERAVALTLAAFTTLVNRTEFAAARTVLKHAEPILVGLRPPYADGERDALFAAGILYLQEKDDWRRAASIFARLRDALVKRAPEGGVPDALFWPALRGEVLALHRLNRGEEALVLLERFISVYQGAPDDLRQQVEGRTR